MVGLLKEEGGKTSVVQRDPIYINSMDSSFLKETVGEALASACAACCVAQPTDPVTYVGEWLLKYVASASIVEDSKREEAVKIAAQAETLEELESRGPYFVPKFTHSPLNSIPDSKTFADVFEDAANEIVSLTSASASYVGVVWDKQTPDAELPEDLEEGAVPAFEDAATPIEGEGETDGEGTSGNEESEVEKKEEEPAAAVDDEAPIDEEEGDDGEVDYSTSTIEYVAVASGSGSVKHVQLPYGEGVTFGLLESDALQAYVPNVMYREGVKYFSSMPRVGAYMAVKLLDPKSKRRAKCAAVLCADTLMPLGSGCALSTEDRSTISACARAIQRAVDSMPRVDPAEGASALKELIDELAGMTRLEFEPPTSTAEELSVALKKLDFTRDQHAKIGTAVAAGGARALDQLLASLSVPSASFKVLRAVMAVLGRDEPSTWYTARSLLGESLLEEVVAYDAGTPNGDTAAWRRAWQCVTGVDTAALHAESCGGAMLLRWVLSARNVAIMSAEVAEVEERKQTEEEEAAAAAAAAEAEAAAAPEEGDETPEAEEGDAPEGDEE